jgi:hypothetical protein
LTTDIPTRRRRPFLAFVGGVLLVFAFLLLLVVVVPVGPRMLDAGALAFSFVMIAVPMGIGYWLLRLGAPDLTASLTARLLAIGRLDSWRRAAARIQSALALTRPRLLASPFRRLELALLVTVLGYLLAPRGARSIGIFVAMSVFALADPLISARRPGWWLNAIKSLVSFAFLFMAAAVIGEVDKIGEAGMVFIAPMMAYPFAVGLSAIIRLLWGLPGEE